MDHVSDIKLIRTDTTLDLSQKAEKGMLLNVFAVCFYSPYVSRNFPNLQYGIKIITVMPLSMNNNYSYLFLNE
ncbi:hypothetical protein AMTRI_Chr08g209820 [Amborella trichopoda]